MEKEVEDMLLELSDAMRWMYLNAKLIADTVLKARNRKALIPKEAYYEGIEDELIGLFLYAPKVEAAQKCEEGILLSVMP